MAFAIKDCTKYLVVSGSHSYGMATPTSDVDVRGWCIPPKDYWLSYHKRFEQHDPSWDFANFPWNGALEAYARSENFTLPNLPIDGVIYNIRKFVNLAADCNPNIIELLFVDNSDVLLCEQEGIILREARDLFLSAKCKFTFSGYAFSQLKRINTHRRWLLTPPKEEPTRAAYGLPEHSVIPADQREAIGKMIDKQVRLWLLEEAEIDKSLVSSIHDGLVDLLATILANKNLVVDAITEKHLFEATEIAAAKYLGVSENYIALLQQEKKYRSEHTEWKQYQSWKTNRNAKRASMEAESGFDRKHGVHLARLLVQCEEILLEGKLTVKDQARAAWLLEIRNGAWSYDKLLEWANVVISRLDQVYKDAAYIVPKTVDANKIDSLYMSMVEKYLWG